MYIYPTRSFRSIIHSPGIVVDSKDPRCVDSQNVCFFVNHVLCRLNFTARKYSVRRSRDSGAREGRGGRKGGSKGGRKRETEGEREGGKMQGRGAVQRGGSEQEQGKAEAAGQETEGWGSENAEAYTR